MKISLRWVFDHLKARMDDVSVEDLVSRFNKAVAEIEHVEKIEIDAFNLSLATCIKKAEKSVVLICKEWQKEIELPLRTDVSLNCSYLIKRSGSDFFWAQAADIGGDKEGLLPALVGDADWKKLLTDDYILHIENKSINHRPDLWCHRGIAREIGALYGFALIPEDELLAPIPKIEAPTKDIFQPAIATQYCTLFGLAYLPSVTVSDSLLFHAVRLIRCAVRPINFIVDLTNYVMLDMGHPMHAVDAEKIASKEIVVTHLPGKKIELLDGKTITLEPNDCVVASHGHPLSLAGIMGGRDASITKNTKSIIIIAEALNPSRIRLSSAFHKIRTEASVRFEKDLDPRGVFIALKRFVKLLPDLSKAPSAVLFAGKLPDAKKIILTLSLIQRSLGTAVSLEKAETVLRLYGFNVSHQTDGAETILTVDIPSWRATKDVSLADDIIEEVGRGIGYASIRPELPTRRMAPFNLLRVARQRALKRAAAQEGLHEVYTYPLIDADFIKRLGLSLPKGILLKNPLAENMSMLVTSLIPNLLRSIMQNNARYDECGFFEQNKIWFLSNQSYEEKTVLAAAWFVKQNGRDFYSYKQAVEKIFKAIDVSFEWRKHAQPPEWLSPYESAELILDGIYEGYAGFVPDKLTKELQGSVFVCEIVVDRLLDVPAKKYSYKPVSRYQPVHLDVSIFVPFGITARAIDQIIRQADPRIQSVELIDFFEKPEWGNKRSQTWRYMCSDETKTMSGAEIEEIMLRVHELLKKQGIEIR